MEALLYEGGVKVNRWTILDNDYTISGKNRKLICRCDCGTEKSVYQHKIQNGTSKSCGCLARELKKCSSKFSAGQQVGAWKMVNYLCRSKWLVECIYCGETHKTLGDNLANKICVCQKPKKILKIKAPKVIHDMVGQVYGELTVLNPVTVHTEKGNYYRTWNCLCSCGNYKKIDRAKLLTGKYNCCGCSMQTPNDLRLAMWTNENFLERCAERVNHNIFDYSRCEYKNSEDKVEIGCTKCGNFWKVKPRGHLSGKGCPFCKSSGFKIKLPGILYVLKYENIYKIGITNKSGQARATKINYSSGKTFEVLKEFYFEFGQNALRCEGIVKRVLQNLYLSPSEKYDGHTESFIDADILIILSVINTAIEEVMNGDITE